MFSCFQQNIQILHLFVLYTIKYCVNNTIWSKNLTKINFDIVFFRNLIKSERLILYKKLFLVGLDEFVRTLIKIGLLIVSN